MLNEWWEMVAKKIDSTKIPNEKKPSVFGYCDNEKKREKNA